MTLLPLIRGRFIRIVAMLWLVTLPAPVLAQNDTVAVLLSRELAPYVAMVEGVEAGLGNVPVQRFFLDEQGQPFSLGDRDAALDPTRYAALVAVGPEALRYLLPRAGGAPLVYGMVLNPARFAAPPQLPCGVSLNIPVAEQLAAIRRQLPGVSRLGVLFDPGNNQEWFNAAATIGAGQGLQLTPLRVSRSGDKFHLVGDLPQVEAILFIPDQTIIAKAIIEYVIKQAALKRIPVIGYNRFFLQSGAVLSFIIDYRAIGQQAAAQVRQLLAGEKCRGEIPPHFTIAVNSEAWRQLGLKPAGEAPR